MYENNVYIKHYAEVKKYPGDIGVQLDLNAADAYKVNLGEAQREGALGYDYNQVQQLVQLDSELQAALKLPEGPIRERAVQTAQNKMADKISGLMTQQVAQNAELTANYDADLDNRMSLAQRAQAAEYLNQRTGQVDAWQDGQTKPRLGTETEQRAESSYRTPEEEYALQSQLAKHFAEEQQAETGGVYDMADNDKLSGWEAKAAVAKEAGISPGVYALYQMALKAADTDGKGVSQAKAKAAVESIDGLTQAQKAYLWQSSNRKWKKNPFGSATVSEYQYAGGEFANPVEGGTISSKFGPRDTFSTSNGASSSRWHKSIDIAAPAGTAIKSVQGGKVTANGWVSGYGWTIEVTHDNGYKSMYHHMQNQSSVAVGTEVKQGQTIGNVGSTGNSTGPHLDLTITKDGTPVDPASLIGDYKSAKTGYVYEGSPVYTQLSSAAGKKSSSGGSRKSGGSSSGGLKQLRGLSGLKGLGF